jgi:hypothetical protein
MNPGLASVTPQQAMSPAPPQQDPQRPEQPPMLAAYAGDDRMDEDADKTAETAMSLVANPNVGPALQQLQKAGQAFQSQGEAAFRNPETLQALSLALKPIIGQSIGSPLNEQERVGDVQIADLIPTGRDTMQVKLLVQPVTEDGQPSREPYEAMLTEGRVPEQQGGKPRELTQQEVQQAIQGLAQIHQMQQQFPDDIARVQQGLASKPPDDQRPLYDLLT